MNITEVRTRLVTRESDKLRAFCSIILDGALVVRDLRIIDGPKGFFVAMPSRKLTERCKECGEKNQLRAKFCGECGTRLPAVRAVQEDGTRTRFHADIVHPINPQAREQLERRMLETYREELERSRLPGYVAVEVANGAYDQDE